MVESQKNQQKRFPENFYLKQTNLGSMKSDALSELPRLQRFDPILIRPWNCGEMPSFCENALAAPSVSPYRTGDNDFSSNKNNEIHYGNR